MIKSASLAEIKKQLSLLDAGELGRLCLRLARYKKENKEMLTYLLFDEQNEEAYRANVKSDLEELFEGLPTANVYLMKKGLRKIIRYMNKQVKFSEVPLTELEVRISFCANVRAANVPLRESRVLNNLYLQQLNRVQRLWERLPEDLQFDYAQDLRSIGIVS